MIKTPQRDCISMVFTFRYRNEIFSSPHTLCSSMFLGLLLIGNLSGNQINLLFINFDLSGNKILIYISFNFVVPPLVRCFPIPCHSRPHTGQIQGDVVPRKTRQPEIETERWSNKKSVPFSNISKSLLNANVEVCLYSCMCMIYKEQGYEIKRAI